jgi:hypothetical protein
VWIAISRWRNISPIFFHQTINSERYCSEILFPFVAQLDEDEIHNAYFQQDGATAHTPNNSMKLLDEAFGERVISNRI